MSEKTPQKAKGVRISLQVHAGDNVVTVLDGDTSCTLLADGSRIAPDVPFGHKVALCDIKEGAPVVKYGVVIGTARAAIGKGEHVHVHNLA